MSEVDEHTDSSSDSEVSSSLSSSSSSSEDKDDEVQTEEVRGPGTQATSGKRKRFEGMSQR